MPEPTNQSQNFVPPRPGDIEIASLSIINFDRSESQDILGLVLEFNVYESIYADHIRADLVLMDALALTTRMPIIGEETVQLKFRTPSVNPDSFTYDWYEMNFRVMNMIRLKPGNIRTGTYMLELVSSTAFMNLTNVVQRAYGPEEISKTVRTIGKDYLGIQQKFTIEETEGQHQFVIPCLKPFESMKFLANEAKSKKYLPSNFTFYETRKGHNFVTIESLKDKLVTEQYFFFDHSLPNDQKPANRNLPLNEVVGNTLPSLDTIFTNRKNPSDFRTMVNLDFTDVFDVEENIAQGMYDNTVFMIDPLLQQFQAIPVSGASNFNYAANFRQFQHTAKSRSGNLARPSSANPLVSDGGNLANLSGKSHFRYLITNKNQDPSFQVYPRHRQDFLPFLISSRGQHNSIKCELTIPGDTDRVAGDLVYFELHEFGGTDDVIGNLNKYISGAYLITHLRHKYTGGDNMPFLTILECVKTCYEAKIENAKVSRSPNLQLPTPAQISATQLPNVTNSPFIESGSQ